MPTDAGLVERTLAFSGSYLSDDGPVRISRARPDTFQYAGNQFVGNCDICARAGLVPGDGEQLADVRAVERFLATHAHGDAD